MADEPEQEFRFRLGSAGESKAFVDVSLSNTERLQLRAHAEPGGSIHRVMVGLLELRKELGLGLISADLHTQAGIIRAQKIQAEMNAVQWTHDMWVRILSLEPSQEPEENV